ncbi:MAG: histidine kinase, partial [Daejeonella sp.]|nr:histidine kinase [Daejeonella sp.]
NVPNLGVHKQSIWVKLNITNTTKNPNLFLELAYPILDVVEFWAPTGNGVYRSKILGESFPFNKRKYKQPNFLFDLSIPQGTTNTYYIRVKSVEQIILPLYLSRSTPTWQHISEDSAINGIYLGIVLIMFLYNLFVFFSVRDMSYLYYVFYIALVGLTQLGIKGYTFQYLWPQSPEFALKSVIILASLSGIGALMVTKSFLHTKTNTPKLHIVLFVLVCLFTAAIGVTVAGAELLGFTIMQIVTSITTLFILIISFMIMIKGYKPAVFFFSAWSILVAGAVVFLLKDYNIFRYNTFTSYAMQAASAIEMALLSFGLADRINTLKKEKEASQAQSLLIAKENERIIREQNEILEGKVHERTVELIASNDELHKTLIDLKEAESQLVESEKMASLGQLTAGIAHEINNPINFVTSNVGPLKRDVEILLDMIDTMESVGLSDNPAQKKKDQIENYKEDIDFDYLKIEINSLLKGIGDGASRTAEIIKGLRIFSRLDEDDLKYADINEGLNSTLILVNNLLNNNKIELVRNLGDIPSIECYPGKLNQVFLNIISNAIYAINKNSGNIPQGILKITTEVEEDSLVIKIEDNGIGMDENTKKKIFEPFFTTKDVGEGTGLGMSITYNTIKRHNGSVHINSTVGVGTEFIIQIPILQKAGTNPRLLNV